MGKLDHNRNGIMLLIETSIDEFVEFVNLWNDEYDMKMVFRGKYGKHTSWTVGNVIVTGVELAPGRVLCEFDNFNLKGADNDARSASRGRPPNRVASSIYWGRPRYFD